jgi:hypothetical protein
MATQKAQNIDCIIWFLRVAICLTFLGHGVFAMHTHAAWVPYITGFGFSEQFAVFIMPYIGYFDVVIALSIIIRPMRIVLIWCVIWAFLTALARPISGAPIWDFVERASNWTVPLVLLFIYGWPSSWKALFHARS